MGASEAGARHAAGADPAKRRQILKGAHAVFSRVGFDAASMNDITREAGVSKGTIYVYFASKEELFESLMEQERDRLFQGLEDALTAPGEPEDRLHAFGVRMATLLCSDEVVGAQRVVFGICERKPELGARFYEGGAQRGVGLLTRFLETAAAEGRLTVEDPRLLAHQFIELSTAGLLRRRLFGHLAEPPSPETVERTVAAAVRMVLLAHAPGHAAP